MPGYTTQHGHIAALLRQIQISKRAFFNLLGGDFESIQSSSTSAWLSGSQQFSINQSQILLWKQKYARQEIKTTILAGLKWLCVGEMWWLFFLLSRNITYIYSFTIQSNSWQLKQIILGGDFYFPMALCQPYIYLKHKDTNGSVKRLGLAREAGLRIFIHTYIGIVPLLTCHYLWSWVVVLWGKEGFKKQG